MTRETVVRQNRCDEEMGFLLFGVLFFFTAMQLLAGSGKDGHINEVNLALYAVFVPGLLFRLGYCWNRMHRMNSEAYRRRWLRGTAAGYAVCFFGMTLILELLPYALTILTGDGKTQMLAALADVFSLQRIPAASALYFALALTSALVCVFDTALGRLCGRRRKMLLVGALCLLCAFLRLRGEAYPAAAAFLGADSQAAVPCVPYFAFFLLGIWFEDEKPGFRWKILLLTAAASVLSLLLYRTPLQDLCRVTISFLPVYLVYLIAEGLSELTLRFSVMKNICRAAGPVTAAGTLLVLGLSLFGGLTELGAVRTLILAAVIAAAVYVGFAVLWVFSRFYEAAARRLEQRTRFRTLLYFAIYTAAFALMLLLVFFVFIAHGKTLVWRADTVSQYYPRAVYFANYIRELVSGFLHGNFELPMYDFRFGLGSEVVYSMEPLYFLIALFGAEHAEVMHTVLILLRFYLAGITVSIFFLYFKKDYFTTFLASAVYVFCGFSLFGGARHPMFMVAMIYLPLLILAVEEILRGRRWYLCTIFVALAMFSNYYFLYMSTFGMGVYFLVRYFCGPYKKSFKNFIGKGLVISASYLLGAAMSCIILVCNIGLYAGSGRSSASIIKTPSLFYYGAQWLLRCFMSFPTTANAPGDWLRLGFLPITFFAVIFLFLRRGRRELKALCVISVICMALPLSGFVLSGFDSITNRWCYMIALPAAYIVADCFPDMLRMSRREFTVCAAWTGLYGFFACFGNCLDTGFTKLAFLLLCVNLAVLALVQEPVKVLSKHGKQCLLVLLTFAMVFHSGFTLFELNQVVGEYASPGEAKRLSENTPLTATETLGDDSFYRVGSPKLDYYTISSSIMFDYNSIYMFNSTMNGNILEYMEKMGATSYSVTQFMGFNNRAFLNAPAAVKYYAYYADNTRPLPYGYDERKRTETNGRETVISENRYALPLGYTYAAEDAITQEELEQYDVLERQEVLLQKVMLADDAQVQRLREGRAADATSGAQKETQEEEQSARPEAITAEEQSVRQDETAKEQSVRPEAITAEEQSARTAQETAEEQNTRAAQETAEEQSTRAAQETAEAQSTRPDPDGVSLTAKPVEIRSVKERGIRLLESGMTTDAATAEKTESGKPRYRLKLRFQGLPESETYVVLKNAFIEGDMSEEAINVTFYAGDSGYEYKFRPDDDRYGTQQQDYVFNLGYHEEALDSLTIRMGREGTIRFDSMELYCQPMENLEDYTQALTENTLTNAEIGTNTVTGEIALDEDRILVLSIPYQRGWTAYVDGQETELLRANYMYMALPLSAGSHTVRLTFAIPGVKYALVIMPCAVVLLIILCLTTWLLRKRRLRKGTSGEK